MADENNLEINIGVNPSQAEAGAKRAASAVGSVVNESKQLDAAFRRLKSAIDPTFAATEKYNQALSEYDRLLKQGKVDQEAYARGVELVKKAYDNQIASIQKNSSIAKQAELEKKQAILEEVKAREASAAQQRQIAAAWLAQEKRNTAVLRQELEARKTAERAYVLEAVAAAKAAAAARVAAMRGEGQTVTKTAETAMIRDAAAAAKQAARERFTAEHQADQEIVASYRQTYNTAKQLVEEASAAAVAAAQQRKAAETAILESQAAVEKAVRREEMQAAREATAVATAAAKERAAAEKQVQAAKRETARAADEAARAARQEAQALNEIRAQINPTFAAQQRYNETMQRATALLMANKLQTGEWLQIQKQAKAQMDVNVRSMGQMNAMNVQIGYQMQDVVASYASGISPLVILAQQGGQTAAALSTMGGTAGRVAAFFAGPWGAAILGAVMVLGFLWDANKKAEDSTVDLKDAESVRKAKLEDLTKSIREYAKAQREANKETIQAALDQQFATKEAQDRVITNYRAAEAKVADLEKQVKELNSLPLGMRDEGWATSLALVNGQLWWARRQANGLKEDYNNAVDANTQAAIAFTRTLAGQSELEIRMQGERAAATGAAERDYAAAAGNAQKQAEIQERYRQRLVEIDTRYNKLKEEEARLRRENASAAREEEKATFQSREDAIGRMGRGLQGKGYNVSENVQFGGVRANHPGMGNKAHGRYAIDVNIPGAGVEANSEVYKRQMDAEVRAAQAAGYRVLWNGKIYEPYGGGPTRSIPKGKNQHRDHAHIEAPESIVGKAAGSQVANEQVQLAEQVRREAFESEIAEVEYRKELAADDLSTVLEWQEKKIEIIRRYSGEESKEYLDALRERERITRQRDKQELQNLANQMRQRTQIRMDALRAEQEAEASKLDNKGENVDFLEQNGLINAQQALAMKAQLLQEEYAMQRAHEEAMYQLKMEGLRAELVLPGTTKQRQLEINQQLEAAQAEHLNRMTQMQTGYARQVADINRQAAQQTLQQWQSITNTFTSGLSSTFQGLWTGSQTLQQGLINLADQMVYKVVDQAIQAAGQQMMIWLGMKTAKQAMNAGELVTETAHQAAKTGVVAAGETARTGIVAGAQATQQGITAATTTAAVAAEGIKTSAAVTGAATQTAAAATAGTAEIGTNAAVAAAGAYKSTVVIPFIGPVAAPAAAALALAAVLGFGALISARGGLDEVPGDQLAMVHKKEMILPAWIAEPMRQQLKAGGSGAMFGAASAAGMAARSEVNNGGDSVNFNYQPTHNNQDSNLESLLRRDGMALRKWIKNEARNGNLKLGGKR